MNIDELIALETKLQGRAVAPVNAVEAQPQPEAVALTDKQIALEIGAAMRRSFSMGLKYWAQVDSGSWSQNKKSFETLAKFNSYIEEVRAVLAAKGTK